MLKIVIDRRGATVVDFALTFPIVLTVFFAAFEVCRFSMLSHTVENAVFEGARRGIIPGATTAECRAEAQRILGTLAIKNATIDIAPAVISRDTRAVKVEIDVPYRGNSFVPLKFFRDHHVRRSLTMIREVEN